MKHIITLILLNLLLISCKEENTKTEPMATPDAAFKSGYSDVNGLKMYYEIHGKGTPLVLIHGGGSTIETSFGRILPQLARHRQVIAVELQAHGHTADRDSDLSFEQDADDVAALLTNLGIGRADIFGFSNGGTTAMYIAARYPDKVNRLILASALCKRNGVPQQFWEFMENATPEQMPQQYKDYYKKVAPKPDNLETMADKCAKRMVNFKDMPDSDIQSIKAPALIIIGDKDVMSPEHAVEMHRLLPDSRLAIIPGGHGEYMGEITTQSKDVFILPMIESFLNTQ